MNVFKHGKLSRLFPFGDKYLYFGVGEVNATQQVNFMADKCRANEKIAAASIVAGSALLYFGLMKAIKSGVYKGMSIACVDISEGTYTLK